MLKTLSTAAFALFLAATASLASTFNFDGTEANTPTYNGAGFIEKRDYGPFFLQTTTANFNHPYFIYGDIRETGGVIDYIGTWNNGPQGLSMVADPGTTFELTGVSLKSTSGVTDRLRIIGYDENGLQMGTEVVDASDFTGVMLEWSNLSRVYFDMAFEGTETGFTQFQIGALGLNGSFSPDGESSGLGRALEPVPLPASGVLLVAAFAGLAVVRRKKG